MVIGGGLAHLTWLSALFDGFSYPSTFVVLIFFADGDGVVFVPWGWWWLLDTWAGLNLTRFLSTVRGPWSLEYCCPQLLGFRSPLMPSLAASLGWIAKNEDFARCFIVCSSSDCFERNSTVLFHFSMTSCSWFLGYFLRRIGKAVFFFDDMFVNCSADTIVFLLIINFVTGFSVSFEIIIIKV